MTTLPSKRPGCPGICADNKLVYLVVGRNAVGVGFFAFFSQKSPPDAA